jgi:hypothetical protein
VSCPLCESRLKRWRRLYTTVATSPFVDRRFFDEFLFAQHGLDPDAFLWAKHDDSEGGGGEENELEVPTEAESKAGAKVPKTGEGQVIH